METVKERGHALWDALHAKWAKRWTWVAILALVAPILYGIVRLVAENFVATWLERPVTAVAAWLWHLQAGPLLLIVAAYCMFVVTVAVVESSPAVKRWLERRRQPGV